jgi:hypothetical protein
MKHLNTRNILLQEAYENNCNIYNMCNIPIYFCNIHMIQLQYTSETFETYNCNIGEREGEPVAGSAMATGSAGIEAGGGRPEQEKREGGSGVRCSCNVLRGAALQRSVTVWVRWVWRCRGGEEAQEE